MLQGKKQKAIQNRINSVKVHANDKIYYCEAVEKEFGAITQPKKAKELEKNSDSDK